MVPKPSIHTVTSIRSDTRGSGNVFYSGVSPAVAAQGHMRVL